MDTEKRKSNKVFLAVLGVATLLTVVVGATFAYFSAADTSETQTITTAKTTLTVTSGDVSVTNIRPTAWGTGSAKDTDTEIVRTTARVQGSTTSSGTYLLYLDHDAITIGNIAGDGGVVGDFKYAVYDSTGTTQIVAPTSFTAAAVTGTNGYQLKPSGQAYTKAYTYTSGNAVTIDDTYKVYIWIENKDAKQNNLQDMSFNVSFTVNGQSTH